MAIRLNRLLITGALDLTTPYCVIREVANAHGFRITDVDARLAQGRSGTLVEQINTAETREIKDPPGQSSYRQLARFINPETHWTEPDRLLESLAFIRRFMVGSDEELPAVPETWTVGSQTEAQPHAFNACILYRYARKYGIPVSPQTSLEVMAQTIKAQLWSDEQIRRSFTLLLPQLNRGDLNRLLLGLNQPLPDQKERRSDRKERTGPPTPTLLPPTEIKRTEITSDQLMACYREIGDPRHLLPRILPRNPVEAIVLAAVIHRVNIRMAPDPLDVFTWSSFRDYPTLDKYFDRYLPEALYTREELRQLGIAEGLTEGEMVPSSLYSNLQVGSLLETFYHGRQLETKNTETPFSFVDLKDLDSNRLLSYGVRGDKMVTLTYEELAGHFEATNFLTNPLTPIPHPNFSPQSIRKLQHLCQLDYKEEAPQTREMRRHLGHVIQGIEVRSGVANQQIQALYTVYRQDEKQRSGIQETLRRLLNMALMMRGWEGPPHPYPITVALVHNQNEVDIRVTQAIREFELSCAELGPVGSQILNLPLLDYQNQEFKVSHLAEKGRTVAERLAIVKANVSTEACIRLSSNWFLSSAYRYMQALNMAPGFNIADVSHIS